MLFGWLAFDVPDTKVARVTKFRIHFISRSLDQGIIVQPVHFLPIFMVSVRGWLKFTILGRKNFLAKLGLLLK
jgi:hypothetical protein